MGRFKVRGETTIQWEMVLRLDEGDHLDAIDKAKELIADHFRIGLDLGSSVLLSGQGETGEVTGQQDRVYKVTDVE